MYLNLNMRNVLLLSFLSIKCSLLRDKELIQRLNKFIPSFFCTKEPYSKTLYYNIDLYDDRDSDEIEECYNDFFFLPSKICKRYFVEIDDRSKIDELVGLLKEKKEFNHNILFSFRNKKGTFIKFIKIFMRRLEEDHIDKVDVMYRYQGVCNYFYLFNEFYVESFNDSLFVLQKKNIGDRWYLEKRNIGNEYLTDLMKDNSHMYLVYVRDLRKKELFSKYFLNYKLLLFNSDSLIREGRLLEKCKNADLRYQDMFSTLNMTCIHILFYFLKDSNVLTNMMKNVLNGCHSEDYFLLRRILKDLKVDFVDGYQIMLSSTNKIIISAIEELNKYIIDDVCKNIRILRIKDDVVNFKRLLLYFYWYLKNVRGNEIDEVIDIIKKVIIPFNFKKNNIKIFRIVVQYLTIISSNYSSISLIYDIFNEREIVFL